MHRILIVAFLLGASLFAQGPKKNILLLHSYHPGMTWVENINDAVQEVLQPQANDLVIYTEYMDTKRHNSEAYYRVLEKLYEEKYRNVRFDLILSSDNNAFDFLVKNRDWLFGDVPVAFCGVNGFEKKMLHGVTGFTGVAEKFSARETVEVMLAQHPDLRSIYIINDYLTTGRAWKKEMEKDLRPFEGKVELVYSENLTLEELKGKVDSLDEHAAVLMGVYYADRDNNYITYEKVGSYLLGDSKAPVYCLLNFNISNNVIGGKVIGGYSQGAAMSRTALRILDGEKPGEIPILFSDSNQYVFNYDGVVRYNLDLSFLPSHSKLLNKPFSLYEEYEFVLFSLIAILASVLVPLVAFLIYIKLKEKSPDTYKESLIILILRFSPVVIVPLTALAVVWLFFYISNQNMERFQEKAKENYIQANKQLSKREVDRFIEIARIRIGNMHGMPPEVVQDRLLEIASDIRYGNSGYLIVGRMDGAMLSHPDENLEGADIFDGKHEAARRVFGKFEEVLEKRGSGFVTYDWENPATHEVEEKITYVRLLPEFGWYVASGVFLGELHSHIEKETEESNRAEQKYINIIIWTSVILVLVTLALSVSVSIILKKVFNNYKKNILIEVEKGKEKDRMLFEQSKRAAMGELIGAIAHQLKQPINAVSVASFALADDYECGEMTQESMDGFVEDIKQSVFFMSKSIDDLRNFFRPDKKRVPYSLNQAIEKALSILYTQISGKGIDLRVELADDVTLTGVENEIQQVVINLLTNAKEALLERKTAHPWIVLRTRVEKEKAVIRIEDNAGGIPPEIIGNVFDPYFTTKGERGTGIGLNLARMIVEKSLEGKITVHNGADGACFVVEVPRMEPAPEGT